MRDVRDHSYKGKGTLRAVFRFLLRLVISALAVLLAVYLVPSQMIRVESFTSALLFALVLGILNAFVRPIILLLTLPLTIITLGLFTLVVNALVFWLASLFPVGVQVEGAVAAFLGALIVSVVSFVASHMLE
jgi:putative membrane protein